MPSATPVFRASDFAQSIGVNTHISWKDTAGWDDVAVIRQSLAYLGVSHVRDGIPFTGWTLPDYVALAKSGVKFDLISSGYTVDTQGDLAQIARLQAAVPGSVAAIEGMNEFNTNHYTLNGIGSYQNPGWAQVFGPHLAAQVRAHPTLSGVPIIAASMASSNADDLRKHGDVSAFVGSSNWHVYHGDGAQPLANLTSGIAQARSTAPGKPVTVTETGYSSAIEGTSWGSGGTPEVHAILTVNTLLDAFKLGAQRTYLYELMDNSANPSRADLENNFGLFLADGTPKLAATAIHNLTSILADGEANASTFATDAIGPSVSGLATTGSVLELQKSSGAHDIIVWNERPLWNAASRTAITPATSAVTLDLGASYASIKVFDPLAGTAPIQTITNASTVSLSLGTHPYVIEVGPARTAPAPSPTPSASVPTASAPASSGRFVLTLSEDAYLGDAQFTVAVDGKVLGGARSVTALHSKGESQAFTFDGDFGGGTHDVAVTFLNDAWGGTPSTDRNLYVDSVSLDGAVSPGAVATLLSVGTAHLSVTAPQSPPDTLTLYMSEHAWNGDAQFTVSVDGRQVGGVQTATALQNSGVTQAFTLQGEFGRGAHNVGVTFLNDAWGGTPDTDRNLFVEGIDLNGVANPVARASLMSAGSVNLSVTDTPPAALDVLRLRIAEDAWKGNAQFNVALDGRTLGASQIAFASQADGENQEFAYTGDFGKGEHRLSVTFLNDAYGGTSATDRNLYVLDASLDGVSYMEAPVGLYGNMQTAELVVVGQ